MFLAIALIAIVIWVLVAAHNDTKIEDEKQRQIAYEEYRKAIYTMNTDCAWCNREYQVKDGDEFFCSAKCEHEQKKANK
jgi:hypothetical protein